MGKDRSAGVMAAINAAGSIGELARRLGIARQAISQNWREIPASRVVQVEEVTGVPREQLRPDLYRTYEEDDEGLIKGFMLS